jgi:hypothetical protein
MWAATDQIQAVDVWAGNLIPQTTGTIDVAGLKAANPGIKLIIARMYGGDSGPDKTYSEVLTHAVETPVEPYLVVSPAKPMATMFQGWSAQIGSSRPRVIWADCERRDGKSVDFITGYIKDVIAEARRLWSWSRIGIYTAAWWWNTAVKHGWEGDIPLWVGHYIWERMLTATTGEQFHRFEPMVARLPIGNMFTPLMPDGWKDIARPVIWQFSDRGTLAPMTRNIDLNFVQRSWYDSLYGGVSVPAPQPLIVEVRHPAGVQIVTVEA